MSAYDAAAVDAALCDLRADLLAAQGTLRDLDGRLERVTLDLARASRALADPARQAADGAPRNPGTPDPPGS